VEQTIGVFGEEMLLWMCVLRQSPRRPPPEHVHRQANLLLDELKASKAAQELPVQSVDDGMFAIAALLDEWALGMPDLRAVWANQPLQSTRWMTYNAGVEFYSPRLERVIQGPKTVFATYVVVLGLGFLGKYGLPGQGREQLYNLRRELGLRIGVDADRDWTGGVLKPSRPDAGPAPFVPKEPWFRNVWVGRGFAIFTIVAGLTTLVAILLRHLG
jgi:type VI secretion system protein ImpK